MNLLVAVNSQYVNPLKTLLQSIVDNNDEKLAVYLMHSGLQDKEIISIKKLTQNRDIHLKLIKIDPTGFSDLPVSKHIPIEAYYRFLVQSVISDEVDRILWMDADMIVNGSLREFYYQSFESNLICVCENIGRPTEELLKKLNLPADSKYFNSGIILFNLSKIRKTIAQKDYFKYIRENRDKITWHDQDVLNVIYNNSSKYCSADKFNRQYFHNTVLSNEQIKEARKNAVIFHFIGSIKPWEYQYKNKLYTEYWRYAKKTEGLKAYCRFIFLRHLYRIYQSVKLSKNRSAYLQNALPCSIKHSSLPGFAKDAWKVPRWHDDKTYKSKTH